MYHRDKRNQANARKISVGFWSTIQGIDEPHYMSNTRCTASRVIYCRALTSYQNTPNTTKGYNTVEGIRDFHETRGYTCRTRQHHGNGAVTISIGCIGHPDVGSHQRKGGATQRLMYSMSGRVTPQKRMPWNRKLRNNWSTKSFFKRHKCQLLWNLQEMGP